MILREPKLFDVYFNTGDWGGSHSAMVIAETAQEALLIYAGGAENLEGWKKKRFDFSAREAGPDLSPRAKSLLNIRNAKDYDVTINLSVTIKEKTL